MVERTSLDVELICGFHRYFERMNYCTVDERESRNEPRIRQRRQVTVLPERFPFFQQKKIQVTFHQEQLLNLDFSGTVCFAVLVLSLSVDD